MIDGVGVGHVTLEGTGVTVVVVPPDTVGSGEVRGGAPAEREFALLDPRRTVAHVDAVVLAGGSAFGLAAADGAMRALAARDRGFPTAGGRVPIVPTMCVFDLLEGRVRPGANDGATAAELAGSSPAPELVGGRVGAGTGATVGKWKGREHAVAGGVGIAHGHADGAGWLAVAVVNAVGDVVGASGEVLAGSTAAAGTTPFPTDVPFEEHANTTLVVVVTDARLDKRECHALAVAAHDGFARALRPAHTSVDGDAVVVLAVGRVVAHADRCAVRAAEITTAAIRAAVGPGVVEWVPS